MTSATANGPYVDCYARYGPHPKKPAEARWRLEHLLEDLDLAGIAGALVQHEQAVHGDPVLANRRLAADLAPHRRRLFPCWAALPEGHGFPSATDFVRAMRDHDVRAVRLDPDLFGLMPTERTWGPLRDVLAAEGTLILLGVNRATRDFSAVAAMTRLFQPAPVLLTGACWRHWRALERLMEEHPNLHLEFSTFQANRAVEYFAGRFGAARCLFGTGLMAMAPGAARGFLDWSLLSGAEVAAIAGGNLIRLLRGAAPATGPCATPWADALTVAARAGRPLPCAVWDNHCHLLHDGCSLPGGGLVFHRGDADGMVEIMRRVGIARTAVMSWAGPVGADADLGNETVARAVARYPDAFIGLATVNPEHQSEAEIEAVIDRYHRTLRFPGLKTLVSSQNLNYDDPRFARWYAFGNRHRLYAVIDPCSRTDSAVIGRLAERYPDLRISLDHCGQSWPYARWAAEMVARYPNVDAQLTYTSVTNGVIEFLVERCGADRVLFGTDAPMRDPRPQAGWLVFTRLMESQKRQIFGANFKRILARAVW